MRAPSRDEKWIDADYLGWPDDGRREIIEGIAYALSAASARRP